MSYSVKEVYCTLQGEGFHTGRAAVFVRFAGCNLWTGREQDRPKAVCSFCDTDFVGTDGPGGGKFKTAEALARHIRGIWEGSVSLEGEAFVVCTGGEPLLQIDDELIRALHTESCFIAVETNGTIAAPPALDWICVSPKADAPIVQTSGHELKLVWYQEKAPPSRFEAFSFDHFYLQPMDGPDTERFTSEAIQYCLKHPKWRLSLQTHKLLGIP
ncbi:MAG: 7-carboxy-7-deazaguanine synthase [Bacteroidetes bacterium]|nr:7-carboxy-7-deazaguanine synthase [Bacteroidota bacterium]